MSIGRPPRPLKASHVRRALKTAMAQNEIGKAAMCEIEYQKSRKAGVGKQKGKRRSENHRNKNGIGKMPCCKTEVPKHGAMKKQGIGRNADALLSKNLSRKIPLPQSLFAQKALCQKPFGNRSHRAGSTGTICSALLRRLTARRPACGAIGSAKISSAPSMPIC